MFVATVDAYTLPAFQQTSSNTHLARKENDPLSHKVKSSIASLSLQGLKQKLTALQRLPENWDNVGSAKPNPLAISNAVNWLEKIYSEIVLAQLEWRAPHISASEAGDVVFEWWRDDHKLTIYFGADQAEFIQVWGAHIKNEMADGQLETAGILSLWKWLSA